MQFADPATAARQTPTRARGLYLPSAHATRGSSAGGTVGATPWERRAYLAFRACARPLFHFAHLFPAVGSSSISDSAFWTERQSDRWTAFASRDELIGVFPAAARLYQAPAPAVPHHPSISSSTAPPLGSPSLISAMPIVFGWGAALQGASAHAQDSRIPEREGRCRTPRALGPVGVRRRAIVPAEMEPLSSESPSAVRPQSQLPRRRSFCLSSLFWQ
ncbi:hypothetical protein C8Q73DRAFT_400572 [Cubamyces lactineus]|nr:hypothetical protein C8Q73DRAFT_400572 [Cubamyces lactineus]